MLSKFFHKSPRRIAYMFSRYPVISQTFCVHEMLALERLGLEIDIASIHPPKENIRHDIHERLQAPVFFTPPAYYNKQLRKRAIAEKKFPEKLIAKHLQQYGESFKPDLRARNALYYTQLFRRRRIEHIHVHFANRATHTALFLHAMTGIPFSFTAHAQDFMVDLGSDELLREMISAAAFVVAVSDFSRNLLVKISPENTKKIHRIYNGIDAGEFPRAKPSDNTGDDPSNPLRIISVGRLIEFKGFQNLINTICELRDRHNIHCTATIVGEGPMRDQLQNQIVALGLEQAVILTGAQPQEEIKKLLSTADLFVLAACLDSQTGAHDILPTVITEAMAVGLPVVSSPLAGIPEMIVEGKSGYLVEPDPKLLAEKISLLAKNPDLRKELSIGSRQHFERNFTLEVTAAELYKLITDKKSQNKAKA